MADVFAEVMAWCNSHPTELVIFDINSCDGDDGCTDAALALVQSLGVYTVNDCGVLPTLTYSGAKSAGKLPGGGSLVAVFDCTEGLYDDTINCYSKDFTCYDSWPADSSNEPWNHMKDYMHKVTVQIPVTDGRLFSAQVQLLFVFIHTVIYFFLQALWQSTASNVILGTLHNSSLLLDESRSKVNKWVAESVLKGDFYYLNLVEVNNVCDGGLDIFEALKTYVPHL
jgi:hypothetical protein